MKNKMLFFVVLLIAADSVVNTKAQQPTQSSNASISDLINGPNRPSDDHNFISDGNYLYGMTSNGGVNELGIVFKIKISDNSFTKILDFTGDNGKNPSSSLTSDGTYLYGITRKGGTNDLGTAFKIKKSDNSYTKIVNFADDNRGIPSGSLTCDGTYLYGMTGTDKKTTLGGIFKIKISDYTYTKIMDFNKATIGEFFGSLILNGTSLYGMSAVGRDAKLGKIIKINTIDNSYTKIFEFTGTSNGSYPHGSLISDGTYLYGMTLTGGANDLGTVFKIKISDNTYKKILDFSGAANGSKPNGSLISDGTYLYGMTTEGGANNLGTAFKIKLSDNSYTKILDFTGTANGSLPYGSFVSDGTYLYGMTMSGGVNDLGTAFKIKISDNSCKKILDFANNKKNPKITWANPADISSGTLLSDLQLNATADVPGTIYYEPAIGAQLNVGANQYLKVFFNPNDATKYNFTSKIVKINVTAASKTEIKNTNKLTDISGKSDAVFNPKLTYGTMTDQEGNTYKTITIGTQTWMAENLRTTKYRNGDTISNVTSKETWISLTTGAYCNYKNIEDANSIATYGRLYNWYAVSDIRNLAPEGWHVPTDAEWTTLTTYIGGEKVAGGKLKEAGTTHWLIPNESATNETGFTALPGGAHYMHGGLDGIRYDGLWWSATKKSFYAFCRGMSYSVSDVSNKDIQKGYGNSVRCVKD